MTTRILIRYYHNGWHHAQLLKTGRKWVTVRDLHLTRREKDGKVTYCRRTRKVKRTETAAPLWE